MKPLPAPVSARLIRRVVGDPSSALARQALLVAGVCLVADAAAFLIAGPLADLGPREWLVLAALVVADAALALPARFSGWVAGGHAVLRIAAAVLLGGTVWQGSVNNAGTLIAGYRAGAWLRGDAAFGALALLAVGIGAEHLIAGSNEGENLAVELLKDAVLPWLVGRYTTARRGHIAALEQQAENQRRDAAAAVVRAVTDERSAIARDLHDVISHHVSAIGMQAGAARLRLSGGGADGVGDTLAAVEATSRSAMIDLRRLLDFLHGNDSGDTGRQPGLDNLEDLLDGVRRAGLPTRLATHGAARPLPGSLDIAVYRITQEMLTNALRHGDGAIVEVELRYDEAAVSVSTRNGIPAAIPARPAPSRHPVSPRGLAGIRTRAAVFDGTIAYGPDPSGRYWQTSATFPLGGDL